MYHIGICDDGIHVCETLESMILYYCKLYNVEADIKVWYTGESLCDYLKTGNHLDILYLDIELFKITGIDVGNYIRSLLDNREMQIVYISNKASYAHQLFKTQPMDFLVKPISQDNIDETLELAFKILRKSQRKFEFQRGKDYYYVPFGDILYFFSEGRKVKIVTPNGIQEFYGKLKEIVFKLPQDFIVIHQSYIVNRKYILRYAYEFVELVDGTVLTISKGHRKDVRERILRDELL